MVKKKTAPEVSEIPEGPKIERNTFHVLADGMSNLSDALRELPMEIHELSCSLSSIRDNLDEVKGEIDAGVLPDLDDLQSTTDTILGNLIDIQEKSNELGNLDELSAKLATIIGQLETIAKLKKETE